MNRMQEMVRDFHLKFGAVVSDRVRLSREELRAKLIMEESCETSSCLRAGDLVGIVDGLCDVLYVTFGTAVEMGVDLEPCFTEVHRSNMAKEGGGERADGKILKPQGWRPPDIANELRKQGAEFDDYPIPDMASGLDLSARVRCLRGGLLPSEIAELRLIRNFMQEEHGFQYDILDRLIGDRDEEMLIGGEP